jgi:hypothetical protein
VPAQSSWSLLPYAVQTVVAQTIAILVHKRAVVHTVGATSYPACGILVKVPAAHQPFTDCLLAVGMLPQLLQRPVATKQQVQSELHSRETDVALAWNKYYNGLGAVALVARHTGNQRWIG